MQSTGQTSTQESSLMQLPVITYVMANSLQTHESRVGLTGNGMPARGGGETAVRDVLAVAADVVDARGQLQRREQPAAAEMMRDFMQVELFPPPFQRLSPDQPSSVRASPPRSSS